MIYSQAPIAPSLFRSWKFSFYFFAHQDPTEAPAESLVSILQSGSEKKLGLESVMPRAYTFSNRTNSGYMKEVQESKEITHLAALHNLPFSE